MTRSRRHAGLALALLAGLSPSLVWAQTVPSAAGGPKPNLVGNIDRPIRYRPDGGDFVIENGGETFNRPLYGGDTAFRDAAAICDWGSPVRTARAGCTRPSRSSRATGLAS
jgi:hypothetical protein